MFDCSKSDHTQNLVLSEVGAFLQYRGMLLNMYLSQLSRHSPESASFANALQVHSHYLRVRIVIKRRPQHLHRRDERRVRHFPGALCTIASWAGTHAGRTALC